MIHQRKGIDTIRATIPAQTNCSGMEAELSLAIHAVGMHIVSSGDAIRYSSLYNTLRHVCVFSGWDIQEMVYIYTYIVSIIYEN